MKKLLDPISNAKTVGYLSIFVGIFGILRYPQSILQPGSFSLLIPIFGLFSSILSLAVGFGLIKLKKWGLYSLIFQTGISLLYMVWYVTTYPKLSTLVIIVNVIFVMISLWFYTARDKFQK